MFKNKQILCLLILLIIPTFWSLLRPGFFPMQDDLQAFRLHQMDQCIQDLQIPCYWIPDMGYQYGYPQFIFYSPLIFYVGEAVHLLGIQFIDVVKILFIAGFIGSALAMYVLLKRFVGLWPALVGTVLYEYAPFRAAEVYVRGSLSEFMALVFFPLLFWSSYRVLEKRDIRSVLLFSVILGGSLTTHNLMNMIFLPLVSIWIMSWIVVEKNWRALRPICLGSFLGLILAAFYLLPLGTERQYVHIETLTSGYFDYRQHFVDVYQLFISNFWGYGSSVFGTDDGVSLSTGPIHALLGLVGAVLCLVQLRSKKMWARVGIILALSELVILFMMHQRSSFLWSMLPFLGWLQFPWRFLAVSIFLLSLLGAWALYALEQRGWQKLSYGVGVVAIIGVIVSHGSFFQPQQWLNMNDAQKFSGELWEKELTISIFDYLPIYATYPPNRKAPSEPEVLSGQATFENYRKGSNWQKGLVVVNSPASIRIPMYDYPGMKVTLDNQQIDHHHLACQGEEYCFGLISVDVPVGKHELVTHLGRTWDRTLGEVLTVVGGVICLLLLNKRHAKI